MALTIKPLYENSILSVILGLFCNRTWDGWLCWDDTPAGEFADQNCPDYFPDFDPTETATKYCDKTGTWFRHPESNRTWSNYTRCNSFTNEKRKLSFFLISDGIHTLLHDYSRTCFVYNLPVDIVGDLLLFQVSDFFRLLFSLLQ
ncbi:hypothetical protein JD844_003179 [Phrynosoma platyrhinos]|uniref:G-protein coupled receptors family 2 profile 1 domain-containing protein n=1 Tax=Phrynosoma platyrhinos TaxID=52577 RepID=A0ABQ7TDH5_PHRPL|nr:hypothetical protein JD844_003179 [Phrynosoma platyrhinos]